MILGYACTINLRIKNNTDKLIEEIKFTYNETSIRVKNIKPNENKQTGISNVYDIKDLKMAVEGLDRAYLIKSEIPKAYVSTIIININSIDSDKCEFDIQEEK